MIYLGCLTGVSMITPFMADHREHIAALAQDGRLLLDLRSQCTDPTDAPVQTCASIVMASPPRDGFRGPAGFDIASLAELIESTSCVAIVAGWYDAEVYDRAAEDIEVDRSTIIIETTPLYQAQWARFVHRAAPNCVVEELPLSRPWWSL